MHIFRKKERYEPPGGCRLFRAWGLPIAGRPAAVSGQPLSEWVLRPSVLEVSLASFWCLAQVSVEQCPYVWQQ